MSYNPYKWVNGVIALLRGAHVPPVITGFWGQPCMNFENSLVDGFDE